MDRVCVAVGGSQKKAVRGNSGGFFVFVLGGPKKGWGVEWFAEVRISEKLRFSGGMGGPFSTPYPYEKGGSGVVCLILQRPFFVPYPIRSRCLTERAPSPFRLLPYQCRL